jgi:hypothetical protein
VGGGRRNEANTDRSVVAGGYWNIAHGITSTISGGQQNFINQDYAPIGGGRNNQIYGAYGTIAGGGGEDSVDANIVTSEYGAIGGGRNNRASGLAATVSGGVGNLAAGDYSFAAGYQAQAKHEGSFVWADHEAGQDFESTAPDQFLVRASGGVGIGTNEPMATLHIQDVEPELILAKADGRQWNMEIGPFGQGDEDLLAIGTRVVGEYQPFFESILTLATDGMVSVDTLRIADGLDLAEPFAVAGLETAQPGMAVSIAPAHPGQLRISDQPYDRMVAGCVSGANGINPGLVMAQEDVTAADAVPVALTGRVYCNFDAASGIYVDPSGQLILYSTEHDNDGPTPSGDSEGSVKFMEFREMPHGSCDDITDAWIELFEDDHFAGQGRTIDYRDRNLENYAEYHQVGLEYFGDQASSARWCIPDGWGYRLYEHSDYGGDTLWIEGRGEYRQIADLADYGFGDRISSSAWINLSNQAERLQDEVTIE